MAAQYSHKTVRIPDLQGSFLCVKQDMSEIQIQAAISLLTGVYVHSATFTRSTVDIDALMVQRQTEARTSWAGFGAPVYSMLFCDLIIISEALMLYDWFLTSSDEWELVWGQKMTVSSWMMVMNRVAIVVNGLDFFLGSLSATVSVNPLVVACGIGFHAYTLDVSAIRSIPDPCLVAKCPTAVRRVRYSTYFRDFSRPSYSQVRIYQRWNASGTDDVPSIFIVANVRIVRPEQIFGGRCLHTELGASHAEFGMRWDFAFDFSSSTIILVYHDVFDVHIASHIGHRSCNATLRLQSSEEWRSLCCLPSSRSAPMVSVCILDLPNLRVLCSQ